MEMGDDSEREFEEYADELQTSIVSYHYYSFSHLFL
jgi:hypothetical protein